VVDSCSADSIFMRPRLESSIARMMIGLGNPNRSDSTFWGTPPTATGKESLGEGFVSFLPAMSTKAAKTTRTTIREWRMASTRNNQRLEDLARFVNPIVRGWMNYYGRFYRSKCVQVLRHLNEALAAWARRKYRRFRRRERASLYWLGRIARRDRTLFAHWQEGVVPEAGS